MQVIKVYKYVININVKFCDQCECNIPKIQPFFNRHDFNYNVGVYTSYSCHVILRLHNTELHEFNNMYNEGLIHENPHLRGFGKLHKCVEKGLHTSPPPAQLGNLTTIMHCTNPHSPYVNSCT